MQAQHRVMRGTWFVEKGPDWVPLRETIADELETAFRSEVRFQGCLQLGPSPRFEFGIRESSALTDVVNVPSS